MKFSGQGPNIHRILAGELSEGGEMYEMFNDMAADWPWPEDSPNEPRVGQECPSCGTTFKQGEMVYLTIETSQWVDFKHITGLTEPVRQEPEK
jgi:hypothetical protein